MRKSQHRRQAQRTGCGAPPSPGGRIPVAGSAGATAISRSHFDHDVDISRDRAYHDIRARGKEGGAGEGAGAGRDLTLSEKLQRLSLSSPPSRDGSARSKRGAGRARPLHEEEAGEEQTLEARVKKARVDLCRSLILAARDNSVVQHYLSQLRYYKGACVEAGQLEELRSCEEIKALGTLADIIERSDPSYPKTYKTLAGTEARNIVALVGYQGRKFTRFTLRAYLWLFTCGYATDIVGACAKSVSDSRLVLRFVVNPDVVYPSQDCVADIVMGTRAVSLLARDAGVERLPVRDARALRHTVGAIVDSRMPFLMAHGDEPRSVSDTGRIARAATSRVTSPAGGNTGRLHEFPGLHWPNPEPLSWNESAPVGHLDIFGVPSTPESDKGRMVAGNWIFRSMLESLEFCSRDFVVNQDDDLPPRSIWITPTDRAMRECMKTYRMNYAEDRKAFFRSLQAAWYPGCSSDLQVGLIRAKGGEFTFSCTKDIMPIITEEGRSMSFHFVKGFSHEIDPDCCVDVKHGTVHREDLFVLVDFMPACASVALSLSAQGRILRERAQRSASSE